MKKIDEVEVGDLNFFGEDKYLFCYFFTENNFDIKDFDKSQIGTASREWIDLLP